MSKTMDPADADGENVGIVKFGPESAPHWCRSSIGWSRTAGSATGRRRPSASSRRSRPLHAIGTGGVPWIEIDFPEDYRRAVRDILPAIDGSIAAPVRGRGQRAGL